MIMYTKPIILLFTLAALAQAAPSSLISRQATTSPIWYLRNVVRTCDDKVQPASCRYTFGIDETNGAAPFHCTYKVQANGAIAQQTNYVNQMCDGSTQFSINSGYDKAGFTTIVVTDQVNFKWAFFGVSDAQFAAAKVTPDPHGKSGPTGTFPTAEMKVDESSLPDVVAT